MNQDKLRKRWKAYFKARAEGQRIPFPDELRDYRCGAKTRAGTPCKRRDVWANGRCKLHGGLSTGPKSGPRAKKPAPPASDNSATDERQHSRDMEAFMANYLRKNGITG